MDKRKKSRKQEERTAKKLNGRVQAGSGCLPLNKGDVRTSVFLIENKYTDTEAYQFRLATWNKIAKEAWRDNMRTPLIQLDLGNGSDAMHLYIMEYDAFISYPGACILHEIECRGRVSCTLHYKEFKNFYEKYGFIAHSLRFTNNIKFVVMDERTFLKVVDSDGIEEW